MEFSGDSHLRYLHSGIHLYSHAFFLWAGISCCFSLSVISGAVVHTLTRAILPTDADVLSSMVGKFWGIVETSHCS